EGTFIDERAFNMLKNMAHHEQHKLHLPSKEQLQPIIRRQWLIVRTYPEQALHAIPTLVPDQKARQSIWAAVVKIAQLKDVLHLDEGVQKRFQEVACALGLTRQWAPGVQESHICPEAVLPPIPPRSAAKKLTRKT